MGKTRQNYLDTLGSTNALPGQKQTKYSNRKQGGFDDSSSGNEDVNWWDTPNTLASQADLVHNKRTTLAPKKTQHFDGDGTTVGNSVLGNSIVIEEKAPPFWTFGVMIITLIVFILEILQYSGFESMKNNPLFGPDESTLLQFGAKYGPAIFDGDWWRFVTATFVQPGLILLLISYFFLYYTKDVEVRYGFFRANLVFWISSLFGHILSALFVPQLISCGTTGAVAGYCMFLLCDIIATRKIRVKPMKEISFQITNIIILIIIGLTPYIDNFDHIGGLFTGLMLSFIILPNMTFGKCERICRGFIALLAFPIYSIIFMICLVLFYRSIAADESWCPVCQKINCVNISGWCPQIIENASQTV